MTDEALTGGMDSLQVLVKQGLLEGVWNSMNVVFWTRR